MLTYGFGLSVFQKSKKINIKTYILFFDLLLKIAIFFYILQQKNFIKKSKKSIKNT